MFEASELKYHLDDSEERLQLLAVQTDRGNWIELTKIMSARAERAEGRVQELEAAVAAEKAQCTAVVDVARELRAECDGLRHAVDLAFVEVERLKAGGK